MKIGITGASGFLGWHLRCFLNGRNDIEVAAGTRDVFDSPTKLADFFSGCQAIVHLAGMNRGDEEQVAATNIELTQKLLEACDSAQVSPHIIFSSSSHIYRDTPYGRSKHICMEKIAEWGQKRGAKVTSLVLPHVFGEGGRPFYNSAVATFCHQLAEKQEPQLLVDGQLDLVHAGDVAQTIFECIAEGKTGKIDIAGHPIKVSALLERLRTMASRYLSQTVPDLREPFDLRLFNTFRSYLYPKHYPMALELRSDSRGSLFENLRTDQGGQVFLSTTKPGITRGNHYHLRKVERFCVIKGTGLIRLRRLMDDAVVEFEVSGDRPVYVDIPTLHTHNITNTGPDEMITMFWSNELFDPANPDTVSEAVRP